MDALLSSSTVSFLCYISVTGGFVSLISKVPTTFRRCTHINLNWAVIGDRTDEESTFVIAIDLVSPVKF